MKNLRISVFFTLSTIIVLVITGCAPASVEPLATSISSQPENTMEENAPLPTNVPHTVAEVEELAGFDVKEPAYLPTGVSFDYATYQEAPFPNVTLHFKLVHETYGDMGAFFQIVQEPQAEAMPNPAACGATGNDCEVLQVGDVAVNYRLTSPTESLMWSSNGFSFQLLRTAGEPEKIYKDELLKVVESMS
ncbi:MAG TPA: hypothetical protein VFQ23_00685 [Anaerolineales bacterium]|nr:hypothetical protein [Anaerolineales bacterium]